MTFSRVIRGLVTLFGVVAGIMAVGVAYVSRRMIAPPRQPLRATPADLGLPYENVQFPASDSVRLSGWFIPAGRPAGSRPDRQGATVVLAHGWGWNRLGDAADDLLANLAGTTPVEFLRLAHVLHHEGYHVLLYDQRNHGESASRPPVTFGQQEALDLIGALQYLQAQPAVDGRRIGVIGFSMGANAVLYALPQTDLIRAAIAVQPATAAAFSDRFAHDMLGPLGGVVMPLVEEVYATVGGVRLAGLQPAFAASGSGMTPVLFVQSKHDRWGSVEDVQRMVAAVPCAEGPLYVDGARAEGYRYLIDNPKIAVTFFEQHL
jgi:pimeloyl-ACP methyl ester carboxylesterase